MTSMDRWPPDGMAEVERSNADGTTRFPDPMPRSSRWARDEWRAANANGCSRQRALASLSLALLLGGLALYPLPAAALGSVFVSYSADGVPSYASQRLDASYRLFIRGETAPESHSKVSKRPAGEGRQQGKLQLTPLIEHYARVHNVTPELVAAVVGVESGYNARALSPKGAVGAMQLMPATAARYGVTNPEDPAQNIDAGVRHLKDLLNEHHGNVALALAAYNAGQGAVARHGGRIPPYRETMLYVPAVLAAAARGSQP